MEWLIKKLDEHGFELICLNCSGQENVFQDEHIRKPKRNFMRRNQKIQKKVVQKNQSQYQTPIQNKKNSGGCLNRSFFQDCFSSQQKRISQIPKLELDEINNTPLLQERNSNIMLTPVKLNDFKIHELQTTMPKKSQEINKNKPDFLEYLGRNDISPLIKPMKNKVLIFNQEEDDNSESLPFTFD